MSPLMTSAPPAFTLFYMGLSPLQPPNPFQEAAAFEAFLTPLLAYDPDSRPSAGQALTHPWLQEGQGQGQT
jgi:serine/threonine protein kinase